MSATVISVKNISKNFGSIEAVRDLSFEVDGATCFGFLGPNGAGKTTMMKMIYGKCTRNKDCDGKMDIFGFDPRNQELDIKYLAGVVPQDNNLDEELDVIGNLMIYARFYNIPKAEAMERINYLLDFLELPGKAHSKIKELSGGMKRRLVIARALINEPKLLILDEPTTGLDPQVRHLIWDKLAKLKDSGTTILLTTHYMEEAFQLCDELVIMHKGQKISQGNPHRLLVENIEKYALELTLSKSIDGLSDPELLKRVRVDRSSGIVRLFADDIDDLKAIADLLEAGHYHLRQGNLEDVFLKATGSTLNVQQ